MRRKYIKRAHAPRKRQNDNLLFEEMQYTGDINAETEYFLTVYDQHSVTELQSLSAQELVYKIDKTKLNWLHVRGLSDVKGIEFLCTKLGISVLWIQDVLDDRHIAKIEEAPNYVFTVLDDYSYSDEEELDKDHLSLILGANIVISFQESHKYRFSSLRKALQENLGLVRTQSIDYLYNLLISKVVENYLVVLDSQRDKLLDMEDVLMEFNSDHEEMGRSIQLIRKDYMRMRKNIMPLKDEFHELLELDNSLVKKSNIVYYKDTLDQLLQVYHLIQNTKENISSILDLYMANTDLRMNHIMKRLTVVSTIFIPLTFLVGVWGMNFHYMPEIAWKWGYLASWIIMFAVGAVVYFWLRKKKWY